MGLSPTTAGYFTLKLSRAQVCSDIGMQFINELKEIVPWGRFTDDYGRTHTIRDYDPETHLWTISSLYRDEVERLWKKYFVSDCYDLFGDERGAQDG